MNKKTIIMTIIAVLFITASLAFWAHVEIERSKKQAVEKAKAVINMTYSTAKKIGQTVFKVKNFKNKIKEEITRLEDSTLICCNCFLFTVIFPAAKC